MPQDYSELIEYLDQKFSRVDEKFDEAAEDRESIRGEVRDLRTVVERLAGLMEKYHQEQAMISAQLTRHEKWIQQIADKIGLELKS